MSGTLEISDELCWTPAGWIYDNVLERIATSIKDKNESLSVLLLESRTDANGGYLDLRTCDGNQFSAVVRGANDAFAQVEREGANSFFDASFFPGFLDQFRRLREMLGTVQHKRTH
jgi:hypothetical protein